MILRQINGNCSLKEQREQIKIKINRISEIC